jgi:Oligoendopeptidase F
VSPAPLSLERLRSEGETFMEELSREYYLAHSGHKATAELQPIYAKHGAILSPDALGLTLEAFQKSPESSEDRRSSRLLLDWQAESQSARQLAGLDEREIAWQGSAVVQVTDTRNIPFEAVSIEMGNSTDAAERHAIEAARAKLVGSELTPIRRERFQRERDITEQLGLASNYNATFELLSGISLSGLKAECEQFLRDTRDLWDEVFPEFAKRVLGMEPADVTRADALALFRARDFDAYFPSSRMEEAIRGQVREMGIDPLAAGRITLDTGEREGKRGRAFCSPVRIPDEVYLVLRPHGGQTDWTTFLHELGHALHFAYMRPDLAFEYRWLGDNSITEGYAMLFDHLMKDAGWLKRYTDLGAARVDPFMRSTGFEELHFLRRYCAKLIYEVELYGGATRWESLPDVYVERLTEATTFRYNSVDAFVDVDPRYYAARYLRAWQLQALITETLTERYDVDWWRNPRAGPWVCSALFGEGQRELAHEQANRVAGKVLSFAPLVRAVERMLG